MDNERQRRIRIRVREERDKILYCRNKRKKKRKNKQKNKQNQRKQRCECKKTLKQTTQSIKGEKKRKKPWREPQSTAEWNGHVSSNISFVLFISFSSLISVIRNRQRVLFLYQSKQLD
jgi:ATP-dependent Zn protease